LRGFCHRSAGHREALGINKRTAEEHLQAAMRKLGAVNRTQAVVIALCQGDIDVCA
jgi:DNA-binding CsgD family transcriptional regulator